MKKADLIEALKDYPDDQEIRIEQRDGNLRVIGEIDCVVEGIGTGSNQVFIVLCYKGK